MKLISCGSKGEAHEHAYPDALTNSRYAAGWEVAQRPKIKEFIAKKMERLELDYIVEAAEIRRHLIKIMEFGTEVSLNTQTGLVEMHMPAQAIAAAKELNYMMGYHAPKQVQATVDVNPIGNLLTQLSENTVLPGVALIKKNDDNE